MFVGWKGKTCEDFHILRPISLTDCIEVSDTRKEHNIQMLFVSVWLVYNLFYE